MNEIQKRITKTSKMVAIILKIGLILVAMAIGLIVIGMGVLTLTGSSTSQSLQDALTITTQGASAVDIAVGNIVVAFCLFIVQLAVAFMVFFMLYRIFAAISKEHTPFTAVNAKRMKQVAILVIIMGVINSIIEFVAQRLLASPEGYSIDLMWVVIAAVIYCIALIFDYGCQLQQQSDETL